MAIFNKNDNEQELSTPKKQPANETTIIANGSNLKGEFDFVCRLHVDGVLEGNIKSDDVVTIGKRGRVKGELKADRLIVNGAFEGNADCTKVEILAEGIFVGDVMSEELIIEAKAQFQGQSKLKTKKHDPIPKFTSIKLDEDEDEEDPVLEPIKKD